MALSTVRCKYVVGLQLGRCVGILASRPFTVAALKALRTLRIAAVANNIPLIAYRAKIAVAAGMIRQISRQPGAEFPFVKQGDSCRRLRSRAPGSPAENSGNDTQPQTVNLNCGSQSFTGINGKESIHWQVNTNDFYRSLILSCSGCIQL